MDAETVRWVVGDIIIPVVICIVSLVVGFISGRSYERKTSQKNTVKLNGNKNIVEQHNHVEGSGEKDG